MNLPPRALQALVDLKQELLSKSDIAESHTREGLPSAEDLDAACEEKRIAEAKHQSPARTAPAPLREELERKTPERTMRHARRRAVRFQRMCQRRQRWGF